MASDTAERASGAQAHCYGALGAGRDDAADSGGGTELYVVIGHAPRQLDRNVTLLGRVVQGMEWLAALPRGPAPAGVYEKPEQRVPIARVRWAADVPEAERISEPIGPAWLRVFNWPDAMSCSCVNGVRRWRLRDSDAI